MKRFFVFAVLAAISLCACQQALEIEDDKTGEAVVFTATTESSATKTALCENGGSYDVVWSSGDQITIVDATTKVGVYTTTSTATRADFTKESGDDAETAPFKAWYPASVYNDGTPALPEVQTYVEGNISGSPMYAESSTNTLEFKNIVGIIRVNVSSTQSNLKVHRIILSADQGLSGEISNAASLSTDFAATVSGTAGVTLDCGEEGVEIGSTAKPFHIAVPANTYTGLKVTVVTTEGTFQVRTLKSDKTIEVGRSQISDITVSFNGIAPVSNLIHHWPFNGSIKDAVAEGAIDAVEDLTGQIKLTSDRFGNPESAYSFDGNARLAIGQAGSFDKSTSFTFNAWINTTYKHQNERCLIRTDAGSGDTGWYVRMVSNGNIQIWEDGYVATSPATYTDGNWHMVTYIRDVDQLVGKLYVDGSEVCSYVMSGGVRNVANGRTHYLGSRGGGEFYRGAMDDVRLYDKALSVDEIAALYGQSCEIEDLGAAETANTYMVSEPGKYRFKATVKGNGGLDPLTGTTATTIDPARIAGVKVLWELYGQGRAIRHDGSAYDISYSDGYVYFSTPDTFTPGDACVAIYDSEGTILWSWVIWATPEPSTMTHNTKTFMDRNLGAINVDNCMRGFLFEWGRKDAFSAANGGYDVYPYVPVASFVFTHSNGSASTMAYTVTHPTEWIRPSTGYSWMSSASEYGAKPWRADVKTIYDPCPAGWRIPTKENITGITGLPNTGICGGYDPSETYKGFGNPDRGYYWTASTDDGDDDRAYAFCNDGRDINHWGQDQGYAIRPVRE